MNRFHVGKTLSRRVFVAFRNVESYQEAKSWQFVEPAAEGAINQLDMHTDNREEPQYWEPDTLCEESVWADVWVAGKYIIAVI